MNAKRPPIGNLAEGTTCPDAGVWLAFHRSLLSPSDGKPLRRHLRRCPACADESRYVAGLLREERCLLREIRSLLPVQGRKRNAFRRPRQTMFRRLAAAAAVVSAAAAIWLVVPSRRPPAAVSAGAFRAYLAVSSSTSRPAPGLFGAPRNHRERWFPRTAELEGGYAPPETAFAIALDSGQTGCLRDWSLALVRETDGPAFSLRTDRLPGKGSITSVRGQS